MNNYGYQPKGTPDTIPDPPTSGSNISQESESVMPTTWYHFVFGDGGFYDDTYAASFKSAIRQLFSTCGENIPMFNKCLKGYDEDDVDGIIELFNHFSRISINSVYIVNKMIYDKMRYNYDKRKA